MRDLDLLRADDDGRHLLDRELMFDDPTRFVGHLAPPRAGNHSERPRVYTHQQVYLDYRASVVAKVQSLREVAASVATDFVWIDTDRCGSDKLMLRIYLEGGHGTVPVRFAPRACERLEPRWVETDPVRLHQASEHVEAILRSRDGEHSAALARWRSLQLLIAQGGTLSACGRRITDALFAAVLHFRPSPVLVSDLVNSAACNAVLDLILNRLADVIAVYNERIEELRRGGIDAKVKPLPNDYLPLFITMPGSQRRARLTLVREGAVALACADDGTRRLCFELGSTHLSVAPLAGRVSWSPDVTLPMLLNDRYSGLVCGRSSALYLLVFNDVMRKVLGMTPIPVLIPSRWDAFGTAFDSLLQAYLEGRTL